MLIYKITNTLNGKFYIGKTRGSLRHRISCHKSESKNDRSNQYIHKAIKKYGFDSFDVEILEDNIASIQILNEREKYYISLYNSTDRNVGYNFTTGGDGGSGFIGKKNPMFGKKRPDVSSRNAQNKNKNYLEIYGEEKAKYIKEKISENSNVMRTKESNEKLGKSIRLAWAMGKYNSEESKEKRRNRPQNLISRNKIKIFCPELNMEFDSLTSAANYIGGKQSNISSVLSGKLKRYKGYTFSRVYDI